MFRRRLSERLVVSRRARQLSQAIESLECRRLLNGVNPAIIVTSTGDTNADDGFTTLREALAVAAATAGDDEITFDATVFDSSSLHTITPGAEPFNIENVGGKVTITGPGTGVLAISGANAGRSFDVDSGADAAISGMTIMDGAGAGMGGGIYSKGTLALDKVIIKNNKIVGATGTDGGGGPGGDGGNAFGGGIYSSGKLTITNSSILQNSVTGGAGGSGFSSAGAAGSAFGAGIYSLADLSLDKVTFSGNVALAGAGASSFTFGSNGGDARGGAVFQSDVTAFDVKHSAFDQNSVEGGSGGSGGLLGAGGGGAGAGGAIYTSGDFTMLSSSFTNNSAKAGAGGANGSPGIGGNASGGAIFAEVSFKADFNTFDGNKVTGGLGGAGTSFSGGTGGDAFGGVVYLNAGVTGYLTHSTIQNSLTEAGAGGAGISLGGGGGGARGGAIYSISGNFILQDNDLNANSATGGKGGLATTGGDGGNANGGAVYWNGSSGTMQFNGGKIRNNVASAGSAAAAASGGNGGSALGGGVYAGGKVTFYDIDLETNTAYGGNGPADDDSQGGSAYGGGIYSTSTLSALKLRAVDNAAQGGFSTGDFGANGYGGGIFFDGSTLSITRSTFNLNNAGGGAVFSGPSMTPNGGYAAGGALAALGTTHTITQSTFDHNFIAGGNGANSTTAKGGNGGDAKGGAILIGGTSKITNSTIYANDAIGGDGGNTTDNASGGNSGAAFGAGVYFDGGTLKLINNTITNNIGDLGKAGTSSGGGVTGTSMDSQGGGMFLSAKATLTNNIVAINSATDGPDVQGVVDASHNLIQSQDGVTYNTDDTNIKNTDPKLGALVDNGGPTLTALPESGSPVYNAGDNDAALAEFGADGFDQRDDGFTRFRGTVDIGAVESGFTVERVFGTGFIPISNGDSTPSLSDGTDFGSQFRYAQQITRTFRVANTGTIPLNISSITVPASYTIIESLDTVINPGASGDAFTVALSTASAGTYAGNIQINSDDFSNPVWVFAITGTISTTFKVNFQPGAADVPEGYVADAGAIFASRGNGLSYGWNLNAANFTRDREILSDQAKDTLVHMQQYGTRTWEINVPNGAYIVHIVAGDAQYFDSTYKINAENTLVVNGKPTSGSRFVEGTQTVVVSDGKLTLTNAAGSINNKIDFIELTPTAAPPPPTIKINFQTTGSPTPAGYLTDSGSTYGNRGNGYSYGWNQSASSQARDRNAILSPDQQHDTFIHTQLYGNRTWEIGVANGTYQVKIVAGDASYTDSVYKYALEGTLKLSGTPNAGNHWIEGTFSITVSDGKLTLTNAAGAVNNKIDFIEITPV